MSDLFARGEEDKRDRLRALGWVRVERYGRLYWQHPETRAWWADEAAVFAWLEEREQGEGTR